MIGHLQVKQHVAVTFSDSLIRPRLTRSDILVSLEFQRCWWEAWGHFVDGIWILCSQPRGDRVLFSVSHNTVF